MKNFYLLVLLVLSISCTGQINKVQIVSDFYKASNEYNFSKLSALTYDTVTIIDGDYLMEYDRQAYYEVFQWDSVFSPHYTMIMNEATASDIFVKISTTSKRFSFLGNNPLVTTHKISFAGSKISKIELIEYVGADFKVWVSKRDELVKWVNKNHPELNGFVQDMTKTGAEKYLKAIRYFTNK